jgi:hypothetical protein
MTIQDLWVVAVILAGFQMTGFTWRVGREVAVGAKDLTWFPIADVINAVSMLVLFLGVFALPVAGVAGVAFARKALGVAIVLVAGYPFVLAGHYEMYNPNTGRSWQYFPPQERVAAAIVTVALLGYVVLLVTNRDGAGGG